MSWRIFSTTSSITLRGSRIELAVFTTSVRMASRRAVVCGARGALAAGPRRGAPRALQVGEHGLRERVRGTPGLDHEVEPEAVDPPQRPGIGGDGQATHGPCGEGAPRRPHRARGRLRADREEGPGEPPRVEPRAAAGGGGEELVLEPSPRGALQAAAERRPAARTGSRIPGAEEDGQACHPGDLSPRP